MSSSAMELEAAVLALPRRERAHLIRRLIESLDEEPGVEDAWEAEIAARLEAIRRGDVETINGPEAVARLKAKYSK